MGPRRARERLAWGWVAGVGLAFALTPSPARAASLDFESHAVFDDPSLQDLAPFSFSPSAVIDETTLGLLVGFDVPGDVAPGSLATSGSQGLVNLFAPELSISLDFPHTALELSLVSLRGAPLSVAAFDAGGRRFGIFDLPAVGAGGFPATRLRIELPGLVVVRISAGPEPTSFFLDDVVAVPEPAAWLLLALAAAVVRRGRAALVAVLLVGCELPGVAIVSPADGEVLAGPSERVEVAFFPPLAAGERVEAVLIAGLDSFPSAIEARDVTGDVELAAGGAAASLELDALAPGRNALSVRRFPAGETRAASFDTVVLDRGGFAGAEQALFGAGVLDQIPVTRPGTLNPAVERTFQVIVWYPADALEPPGTGLFGGVVDAAIAAGAEDLPVVLFSHGNCGVSFQSTFLTASLARAGYVVAAMSHPGNTFFDVGCGEPGSRCARSSSGPTT